MSSKHTPGPWIAVPVSRRYRLNAEPIFPNSIWAIFEEDTSEGRNPVVMVDHGDDHCPEFRAQVESVARLIAAAPLMLEALEAVEWGQHFGYCPGCLEEKKLGHEKGCKVAAALKAARGEPTCTPNPKENPDV